MSRKNSWKIRCFFPGPQFNEAKTACYRNADGFILPSLSEGLPMVALEAWSHKLPVLMTPACNLQEGFDAGAAVQIQTEVDDMALQLRDFFTLSLRDREEMGQQGYGLVAEKFTWDRVAEDMYEVYQWVLGGGSPPSCVITD